MSQDGQRFALAMFFLQAGKQLLAGRVVPQQQDGGFGEGLLEVSITHFGA
jgi:hypothetical protein